jgi:hypothetical protein
LSHVDTSISIGEPNLEMGINSVGSGTRVKRDSSSSRGDARSNLSAEHVRMKSVF